MFLQPIKKINDISKSRKFDFICFVFRTMFIIIKDDMIFGMLQFNNWLQRVRVWLVALARTKLVNKNEPEEIPKEFPSKR